MTELSQTFTAPQSGALAVLELQVEANAYGDALTQLPPVTVGIDFLDATGASLGEKALQLRKGQPLPLLTQGNSNRILLIAFGILVSVTAGQVLTLRLTHPPGDPAPCIAIRDGADSYSGGQELRDGVAFPNRDLAFRLTIQ